MVCGLGNVRTQVFQLNEKFAGWQVSKRGQQFRRICPVIAEFLCLTKVAIASRYWSEHCSLQTKKSLIIGLLCKGIQNSF